MLTDEVISYIDNCVLCWLATASNDGQPNVSPKELFGYYEDDLVIAHIASPQSIKNIRQNPKVCVSFIDIFVQKGYQLKGTAKIIGKDDPSFDIVGFKLLEMAGENYPIQSLIQVSIASIKPIVAPSYRLFPDTTEEEMRQAAMKTYGVTQI